MRPGEDPPYRVKRVAALAGDQVPDWLSVAVAPHQEVPLGHLAIVGDNARSQDSRQLGFIDERMVVARCERP